MKVLLNVSMFILLASSFGLSQDPMPVLGFKWERIAQRAQTQAASSNRPVREVTADNKYFQRKAREQRTDVTIDPNETTIDGRSAAIDKAVQESRTPKNDDISGYSYSAQVRNDSGKTVTVVYWEYRFTELARPANVVRRQFLCSVKLKNKETADLDVFSLLGPSEVIDVQSVSTSTEKLFDEKVLINRIEFGDGTLRQRGNWKFEDVEAAVRKATSAPWGKETCRSL